MNVVTHRAVADIEADLIIAIRAQIAARQKVDAMVEQAKAAEEAHMQCCADSGQLREELLKAIAAKAGAFRP